MGDLASTAANRTAGVASFCLLPMTPADDAFVSELYADLTGPELAPLGWDASQVAGLLDLQFRARQAAYRAEYPDAEDWLVVVDGRPAGRLLLARRPDGHRVVDVVLLSQHRGRGVGTALIAGVQAVAAEARVGVDLAVEAGNERLARWYDRLGFDVVGRDDVLLRMAWVPPRAD
jgi:ribosomal protein S18 acetylase RimI-like enzyme